MLAEFSSRTAKFISPAKRDADESPPHPATRDELVIDKLLLEKTIQAANIDSRILAERRTALSLHPTGVVENG